jgi:hypothetical protein
MARARQSLDIMTRPDVNHGLRAGDFFARCLPARYDKPFDASGQSRLLTTFALQRSGQHVVIDWICRGLVDALHLNNCRFYREGWSVILTPMMGRRVVYSRDAIQDSGVQGRRAYRRSLPERTPANLVYSLENQSLNHQSARRLLARFHPYVVVILRDPANWLASSIRHGLHDRATLKANIAVLKEYLRFAHEHLSNGSGRGVAINFNRFTNDDGYRRALAEKLELAGFDRAEDALRHTPDFGGGSSFKAEQGQSTSVHDRFLEYQSDPFFQAALQDPELIALAEPFFISLPGLKSR